LGWLSLRLIVRLCLLTSSGSIPRAGPIGAAAATPPTTRRQFRAAWLLLQFRLPIGEWFLGGRPGTLRHGVLGSRFLWLGCRRRVAGNCFHLIDDPLENFPLLHGGLPGSDLDLRGWLHLDERDTTLFLMNPMADAILHQGVLEHLAFHPTGVFIHDPFKWLVVGDHHWGQRPDADPDRRLGRRAFAIPGSIPPLLRAGRRLFWRHGLDPFLPLGAFDGLNDLLPGRPLGGAPTTRTTATATAVLLISLPRRLNGSTLRLNRLHDLLRLRRRRRLGRRVLPISQPPLSTLTRGCRSSWR
jgi:hypothetical protein